MNTLKKGVRSEANLHRSSSPRRKMKEPPIAKRMSVCSFEEEHNETQFVSVVVREPSSPQQPQPSLQQRQQKLAYLQTRACHTEQQHSPVKQNNFNQKILQQSNQLPIENSTWQNFSGENNLFPKQQQPSQTKSKFLTLPRQIKHKTIEPKKSQQQQIEQQATATTQILQQLPRHQQFHSVNASSTLPKYLPAKSTQPAWILGGDEDGDGDVGGRRGSNSGILVVNREVRIQSVGTLERKNKFGNKKQLSVTEFIRDFNEPLITHSQQRQVGLPRTIQTPEKQQAIRPRQLLFSEDPIMFNHSGPSEFTLKKNKYKSESNLRDNKFGSTEPISQISTQSKFDLPPQLPPRNDPFKNAFKRIVTMTKKKPVGYGFALDCSKIDPTVCKISNYANNFPIFSRILFGSLAWEAGIFSGDYLLQVNGISVESMKEGAVVNLIQQNLRSVELMVATMSNKLKKSAETAASSPLAAPYIKNSVVNITQQQPQPTTPTQRHKPQKQPSMRSNFGIYEEINIYCEEDENDANGFNKNGNINKNNISKPQQSPKEFSNNQKKHEPSGNQLQQKTETAVLSIHDDDACSSVMPSIKLPSLTISKMQKSKNNLKGTTGNQNESADEDAFDNVVCANVGKKKNTFLSSPTSLQQPQIAEQLKKLSSISSPTATTSTALRKVSCSESSGFVSEGAENSSDGSLPSSTSSDNTFNHCTDNCNGNTSNDCNNIFNKNFNSAINDEMMKPMLPTPNNSSKIHQITSQLHQHKQQQQLPAPDVAPPIPPRIKNPVQTEKTSEMKKLHNLITRCQDDADKQNVEKTFHQYFNNPHDQLRQTNHNTHNYATNFMQQSHLKVSRKPLPPLPPTQLSLSPQSEIFRPQNQTFFQKENKMGHRQARCLLHNDTDQTPIKSRNSDSETSRSVEAIDPTPGIVAPPDEFSAGNNNPIDGCKPTRPSFLDLISQTSFLSPTKTSFSPVCSANTSSSPSIPIPKPTYLFNRLSNNFIITTPNNCNTFPSNDSNITADDEGINNTNNADDNNDLDVHNSAENRLNCKQIEQWSVDDVCTWLLHIGFHSYEDSFRKHSIEGEGMLKLKRLDLIKLGMEDVVARRDFQRAVVRVQLKKYDESSC